MTSTEVALPALCHTSDHSIAVASGIFATKPLEMPAQSVENRSLPDNTSQTQAANHATTSPMQPEQLREQSSEAASPPVTVRNASQSPKAMQPDLTIRTSTSFKNYQPRSEDDDPPQSVIHAPPGFGDFRTSINERSDDTPKQSSTAPAEALAAQAHDAGGKRLSNSPLSPPPLTTSIAPAKDWSERATPRAQTRQEFEEAERRAHATNLDDIPEGADAEAAARELEEVTETFESRSATPTSQETEINALRAALAECWTLCNTLASLSYIHRERQFGPRGTVDMQEEAWRSCWRLCRKLYEGQEDDYASQVSPTLDLCRQFCQALFEVRVRDNDLADSVLRVSFELNNHLYNTHDRNLPDAFRERTLDFYITLCHRLMKQRTRVTETDALLIACWSLAEMLFSIRQNKRENKRLDEELLGSAVQACWELCDIFREGWTLRSLKHSDRGTPRPSPATFTQAYHEARQTDGPLVDETPGPPGNPETPTTIFEDTVTVGSPDEAPAPNIFILGHAANQSAHHKWSSSSSDISGQTHSSEPSVSSSNTLRTISENLDLTHLRVLVVNAAINSGYQRTGSQSLSSFVKLLSSDAFGSSPWQMSLLRTYKNLVAIDPAFKTAGAPARATSVEISRAVQTMVRNGQYAWLRDLYRLVFGFHVDDAMSRKTVTVHI